MSAAGSWYGEYQREINLAHLARANGKDGMARVCARRAAGIILREYMQRNGVSPQSQSVFPMVRSFQRLPGVTKEQKAIANHFLMTVDQEFNLPASIDLIADAERLAHELLDVE